jgi:hypothetical protein
MEKEPTSEFNQAQENKIIEEEIKIQAQPKKLSLSDINPSDLNARIENFFSEKLETLESKFQNDLVIVEPFKFQFIDLYHDLENLKKEILDFLKKEEEKKTQKKPTAGAKSITRINTSRSRTPIKFDPTASKLASTRDLTKSANTKGNLDKSRSKTPLTSSKLNDKSKKDVSVSKTDKKKTLNTSANVASTLKTAKANTAKKPNLIDASGKKRDVTPVSSTKINKALDISVISHNEHVHTEHANNSANTAKKQNLAKTGIKGEVKANVASAILKKPKGAIATESATSSKRKSALNITSGTVAEGQPSISSFNSNIDLTAKKKSFVGGGLNISVNSDLAHSNYASNNNLENNNNNNGSNAARASISKANGKVERKASLPAKRGSVNDNKRNSVEVKKENVNGSVDKKGENKDKVEEITKPDQKRKSIEVKKIEIEQNNNEKNNNNQEEEEVKKEEIFEAAHTQSNNDNNNKNKNLSEKNDTRKSISDMFFGDQGDKSNYEDKKEDDKIEMNIINNDSANNQADNRQLIKQEKELVNSNAAEKAENDVKVAEEYEKSVVAENIDVSNNSANDDNKQEEFKVENNEIKSQETTGVVQKSDNSEVIRSNGVMKKSLLMSFINKKSCGLHLCINSG